MSFRGINFRAINFRTHWRDQVQKTTKRGLLFVALLGVFTLVFLDFQFNLLSLRSRSNSKKGEVLRSDVLEYSERKPVKKVLIIAYMRSGSSLLGSVFSTHPKSFYMFEPLGSFQSHICSEVCYKDPSNLTTPYYYEGAHSKITMWENVEFLHKLLTCNTKSLPINALFSKYIFSNTHYSLSDKYVPCLIREVTGGESKKRMGPIVDTIYHECEHHIHPYCTRNPGHRFLVNCTRKKMYNEAQYDRYKDCIDELTRKVQKCGAPFHYACTNAEVVAHKILRLRLADTYRIMTRHPDVQVIHLVRDPRAMLSSRDWEGLLFKPMGDTANILCNSMIADNKAFVQLNSTFPGRYMQLRYEDLVRNPQYWVRQLYRFIGEQVPSITYHEIEQRTRAKKDGTSFDTFRANPLGPMEKWKKRMNIEQKITTTRICHDALELFRYKTTY